MLRAEITRGKEMAFTKITNVELNSRGATTLPNVPTIGATALKQEFDAPAKQVVAPKFNNLIDELQASTASADLGASAPTGRSGTSVQGVLNSLSTDLGNVEASSHSHPNKAVIDKFADDGTGLTYDGSPISGAVESVNGKTGAVELDASDVGALPDDTVIPSKTSDLTNDSGFVTSSDLPTKTSDLTNDSNFVADASYVHTDNNYDATAKGIVDGATAAIAAKSTVSWNQQITTGQRIAVVTINGTPTDVYAPTSGGGGGGSVDSVNGYTGTVVLTAADVGALPSTTSIPTKVSDLTNDSGYQTASDVSTAISGKADSATTLAGYGITNAYTKSEVDSALGGKASASDVSAIQGLIPSSATTSNKLATASDIPAAAKDGTLTISQNGTTKGTFSADQSSNATANIVTDEWHGLTKTVSSGMFNFTVDDSKGYGYEVFVDITGSSVNKNPSYQISSISGSGTSSCDIYFTTDADEGATVKLRYIK
jgi:hypothetical protein